MRFLLLGASAVVAVLAVVYTCQSSESPADRGRTGRGKKVTFFVVPFNPKGHVHKSMFCASLVAGLPSGLNQRDYRKI